MIRNAGFMILNLYSWESNGRLLPLCVWCKAEVAAGLRTSTQRKDGCDVGEPMKTNWNLYLFLTASNLSDAGGVQKELVTFTVKTCTYNNSKKQKVKIWQEAGERERRDCPVSTRWACGSASTRRSSTYLVVPTNLRACGLLLHFPFPNLMHISFVVNPNLTLTPNHRGSEFWKLRPSLFDTWQSHRGPLLVYISLLTMFNFEVQIISKPCLYLTSCNSCPKLNTNPLSQKNIKSLYPSFGDLCSSSS